MNGVNHGGVHAKFIHQFLLYKERVGDDLVGFGQAWLKTGSLRDVMSVAGYVQGQSGQRYTLVAVLHHPNAQQGRAALDQLLEWTVRDMDSDPAKPRKPQTVQRSKAR